MIESSAVTPTWEEPGFFTGQGLFAGQYRDFRRFNQWPQKGRRRKGPKIALLYDGVAHAVIRSGPSDQAPTGMKDKKYRKKMMNNLPHHIIVYDSRGGVSIKAFPGVLIRVLSITTLSLAVLVMFFGTRSLSLYRESQIYGTRVENLKKQIVRIQNETVQMKRQLPLAQDNAGDDSRYAGRGWASPKRWVGGSENDFPNTALVNSDSLRNRSQDPVLQDPAGPSQVAVTDLGFSAAGQGDGYQLRFRVQNIARQPEQISGYVFAVLKPGDENPANWKIMPPCTLAGGMPSRYETGETFCIQNFKLMTFTFSLGAENIKNAAIFIFDPKGRLLLLEEHGIPL